MSNPPKVAVIGGGISGLTAGIYLIKHGFDVEIIEKNHNTGGLCTGWTRKGSYIDGCIHWLTESGHGELHDVMRELGLIKTEADIINLEAYSQACVDGKEINFFTDADKLGAELLRFATKNDKPKIEKFIKHVRKCRRNMITAGRPYHLWTLTDKLRFFWRILPLIGTMKGYAKISINEFAESLESKELQFCFRHTFVPNRYSMFSLLNTIGGICDKNGGLPSGGSRMFAKRLEDRYIKDGGKLTTGISVNRIITEGDTAKGIELSNGETVAYDYIVPACSLHFTLDTLLGNKFRIKRIDEYDANKKGSPIYSLFMVSCRTPKNLDRLNVNRYIKTDEFEVLGAKFDSLYIKHFGYDKSLSANGETVVQLILESSESHFDQLSAMSKEEYAVFKQEFASQMMGIARRVCADEYGELELLDVCTPLTFTHWTNTYKGTFMTYMLTENNKQLILRNDILPLRNVVLAGHWMMMPGGIPIAILQGKFAADTIKYQHDNPDKFNLTTRMKTMNASSLNTEGGKVFGRKV